MIPFFLEKAFKDKKESERFYLVLADSGMGKTTFMVNLYLQYYSFWNRHREKGVELRLFRLGEKETLDKVKKIEEATAVNTILLLDALDEDPYLLPQKAGISEAVAFRARVDEIIQATKNFREVVLTCRTQYFPGQENNPYELELKRPDEEGFYRLNKLYISPFTPEEVDQYLDKKFPFWKLHQRKQKKQAAKIVKSSTKLLVRPMLLSYIDYLLEGNQDNSNIYKIYENLVEQWLKREAAKRKPIKEKQAFIANLRAVSAKTAMTIYRRKNQNKGLSLSKKEAEAIAKDHQIDLKSNEVTGQSLLTCDGASNWKFAHKSILEFFIAREMLRDFVFARGVLKERFAGMDMVKEFCFDVGGIDNMVFVKGGRFKQEKRQVHLEDFAIGKTQVTQKEWEVVMGNNPSHFKGAERPVEQVTWYDAIEFCNRLSEKYGLDAYYSIDKSQKDPNNLYEDDKVKWLVEINEVAKGFRLPTEAEWEFAARGGVKSKGYTYAGSNKLNKVGWYDANSKERTHNVGELAPNELGLYDMSGNVWEWCYDWYGSYGDGEVTNPLGASNGKGRVLRGGSWVLSATNCGVSGRNCYDADFLYYFVGFRLAYSL